MRKLVLMLVVAVFAVGINGCAVNFFKGKPGDVKKIQQLTTQLEELEATKRMLEERLAKEIGDKQILLERTSRGLVITMTNDILFDSGKAKLKHHAKTVLNKIAGVLKETAPDRDIGVEGPNGFNAEIDVMCPCSGTAVSGTPADMDGRIFAAVSG